MDWSQNGFPNHVRSRKIVSRSEAINVHSEESRLTAIHGTRVDIPLMFLMNPYTTDLYHCLVKIQMWYLPSDIRNKDSPVSVGTRADWLHIGGISCSTGWSNNPWMLCSFRNPIGPSGNKSNITACTVVALPRPVDCWVWSLGKFVTHINFLGMKSFLADLFTYAYIASPTALTSFMFINT